MSEGLIPIEPLRPDGKPRCKTINRQTGLQCKAQTVNDTPVCRIHGGMGGRPITSGKYSKNLPAGIQARYEEFINSPSWVELRDQIGLLDLRIEELIVRIEHGDSVESRVEILKAMRKVHDDLREGVHVDDVAKEVENLLRYLDDARRKDEANDNLLNTIEQQRKLKETEVKRMVAANQVLTIAESYALIRRLVTFVEDYIEDPQARNRAIRELVQLLERKGTRGDE